MRTPAAAAKQAECVWPKIALAEINPSDQSSNEIGVSVSGLNEASQLICPVCELPEFQTCLNWNFATGKAGQLVCEASAGR
jgi:hypothetical protein